MSVALSVDFIKVELQAKQRSPWLHLLYFVSGLLLSSLSARAEAPALSQEFWLYLVEFGDGQGEIFDPSDYAVVTSLPAKARQPSAPISNAKPAERGLRDTQPAQEVSQ